MPVPLANQHPPPPTPPPNLPALLDGKKILIVDDETDIRRLVSMMLSKRGVESIAVPSADDALDVLAEYGDQIGLVLLDLSVPNSARTRALERIKTRHPGLPVIVMSGLTQREAKIDPAYGDSVGFLRKPFQPAALYEALGQRRARRDSGGRDREGRDSKGNTRRGTPS